MDAGESDACAEFRRRAFGAEFGRLKDGIESVERRAVLQTGIVVGGPPGGCPPKTYLFIDKEIEAEILKDAAHGRCGIQCPVAKSIDALARGTGAGGAKSKVPRIRIAHVRDAGDLESGNPHIVRTDAVGARYFQSVQPVIAVLFVAVRADVLAGVADAVKRKKDV